MVNFRIRPHRSSATFLETLKPGLFNGEYIYYKENLLKRFFQAWPELNRSKSDQSVVI